MSYDQLLQDLLEELEKCESLKEIRNSLDPFTAVNNVLKRLNTADWKISIGRTYGFNVETTKRIRIGNHGWLKPYSFEEFKKNVMDAVNYYLTFMESRKYSSIKDYREKAVPIAIEIRDKITEDLYEDVMAELRRGKDDKNSKKIAKNLTTKISNYYYKLVNMIRAVAKAWVIENLAPGMKVLVPDDKTYTVAKVIKNSGSIAVVLKGSDKGIYDLEELNVLTIWCHHVKEAGNIYGRVLDVGTYK